ncbi:MAG: hypothetical protein ACR2N3_18315 [Pyrinomonadaceae bacterium]
MSWLISLLIAGAMFSSENNLPVFQANNYTETKNISVVKADESERFEQIYPLSANGKVSVSNVNGSITIEGWDRPEVKLEYVKNADTKEHLADVQVKIDAQKDSLDVEAEYNSAWNRNNNGNWKNKNDKNVQVEFHLMVPRNAALNEIETVNGSVSVSNTTNSAKVSAVNGEVKAVNLSGAAELSTVNGTVTADFERLDNSSRISLETVNGQAFLTLPSDINATVRAETTNGKITNDFGLPVRNGQFVGHSLYGKIGTGDAKIKLESVNGELSVRRRQDGKNPNPVTNLLNSKTDDNGDEDFVDSDKDASKAIRKAGKVKVEIPEINAEVQRAMADAQREIAKAKINVNINSAEMQQTIREAMAQQRAAMQNMRGDDWFGGAPSIERKTESFTVRGIPKVTIDAKNCAVFVRGWDKPEVQYVVMRISKNNFSMPVQPSVTHTDSEVNIKFAENNLPPENGFDGDMHLQVEVFVPRKSNLQIITNREVRLENVSGELNVQGGAEAVNVRDSDGNLNVSAAGGKVRVIGFRGAVDAKTDDGLMSLEGDFQKLSARTVSGTIVLTLPENANATIESNRKDIIGEGITLAYQGDEKNASVWKIGSGGTENYLLYTTADGRIFVRNSNLMKTN